MSFLTPTAALIAAGIVVPALMALYFLKLRRRLMVVSSTLLWRKAIEDLAVNAPFQRLRRNLLLLLQLLVLVGLLFAFARPTTRGAADDGKRVAILIDHSASMNATDVDPSRLERARELALQIIDDYDAGDIGGGVMVVSFARQARVVQPFTTDRALLRRAVRSIEATDERTQLSPALELVEPFARPRTESDDKAPPLTVYLITDGRVHDAHRLSIAGGHVRLVNVVPHADEAKPDNVAIVSLAARRDRARPSMVQVFAQLANYGAQPVDTTVTLAIDGVEQQRSTQHLPGAAAEVASGSDRPGAASLSFELEATDAALVEVRHDHPDVLAVDDAAALVIARPREPRVLLVTKGNVFLERVIRAVGVKQLAVMTTERYDALDPWSLRRGADGSDTDATGYDVIVFDSHAPKALPPPPIATLSFDAPPPIEGLRLVPSNAAGSDVQYPLDWSRDDPVMRYVALDDVLIDRPGRLALPAGEHIGSRVLVMGEAGPLVAQVVVDGVPHIVAAVSLLRSNWPMQVSFAVFIDNAIRSLASINESDVAIAYRPGDVAIIDTPADDDAAVTYSGPTTLTARASRNRAVLPAFERAGVYHATAGSAPPVASGDELAVNMTDPIESDPRPLVDLSIGQKPVTVVAGSGDTGLEREVWRWFILAALAALLIEWIVYTRRMHL